MSEISFPLQTTLKYVINIWSDYCSLALGVLISVVPDNNYTYSQYIAVSSCGSDFESAKLFPAIWEIKSYS